jgi:hypothetical protein
MKWRYGLVKYKNDYEDTYTLVVTEVYLNRDKPIALLEGEAELSKSFSNEEEEADAVARMIAMLEEVLEDCKNNAVVDAYSLFLSTKDDPYDYTDDTNEYMASSLCTKDTK